MVVPVKDTCIAKSGAAPVPIVQIMLGGSQGILPEHEVVHQDRGKIPGIVPVPLQLRRRIDGIVQATVLPNNLVDLLKVAVPYLELRDVGRLGIHDKRSVLDGFGIPGIQHRRIRKDMVHAHRVPFTVYPAGKIVAFLGNRDFHLVELALVIGVAG